MKRVVKKVSIQIITLKVEKTDIDIISSGL